MHQAVDSRLVNAVLHGQQCLSESEAVKLFVAGIQRMLEQQDYDGLERLAARYKKTRETLPNGSYKSITFYYALKVPREDESASNLPVRLHRWMKARPESPVPKIAMARLLHEAADGRWNGTLPSPYAKYFEDPLKSAGRLLKEAEALTSDDADLYALLVEQATRAGAPESTIKAYLAKGRAINPTSYHLDAQYARYITRRSGDWSLALSRPANALHVIEAYLFRPPPISAGKRIEYYQETAKLYPNSTYVKNAIAEQAVKARDYQLAAKMFNQIGDQHEVYIWSWDDFDEARRRVEQRTQQKLNLTPPPLTPVPVEFKDQNIEEFQFKIAVTGLMRRERFGELDQILNRVRTSKSYFDGLHPKINAFYQALEEPQNGGFEKLEERRKAFDKWLAVSPDSASANIGYLDMLIEEAWDIRGRGYADTVSPRQWEGFNRVLLQARERFEKYEASDLPKDPVFYASRITIGMGLNQPGTELFTYFKKGRQIDRFNLAPYVALHTALDSRWGGTDEERQRFQKDIPLELIQFFLPDEEPEKRSRGAMALAKKQPTDYNWSVALRLAKFAGNKSRARDCLDQLQGRWSGKAFLDRADFEEVQSWARS